MNHTDKLIKKTWIYEYNFSKNDISVLNTLSNISKNVFNTTVFCFTVFDKYKNSIYKDLLDFVKKENINTYSQNIDDHLQNIYEKYYFSHCNLMNDYNNNNKFIYQYIIKIINDNNIVVTNSNYFQYVDQFVKELSLSKLLIFNSENKYELIDSIVIKIMKSIYNKNFFKVKYEINNNIKISIPNNELIDNVKTDQYLFKKNDDIPINYKDQIEKLLVNSDKVKKLTGKSNKNKSDLDDKEIIKETIKKENKLCSNRNYITRFIYKHLGDNINLLPSDLIINIIDKAYESINSYYSLKDKGIKANKPKYLLKSSLFILPFFKQSRREIVVFDEKKIRLTVGQNIAKNYLSITNDKNLICLNDNVNTHYKKYVNREYLEKTDKFVGKGKNYIVNKSDKDTIYINKNSDYIIEAYYLDINFPMELDNENIEIKLIEIVSKYDGHSYNVHFVYDEINKVIESTNIGDKLTDYISIDTGINNLLAIYDPSGSQYIISGKYLVYINNKYNYLIDKIKSKTKKINNEFTSKRIRNLLIERDNIINNHLDLIVNWVSDNYKDKKIIIGKNLNWKNGVNMGKENNRTFYAIPYSKLIKKLKFKMSLLGSELIINEESYTSKCDALALEEVKKQDNYMGNRIQRGLFSSSKNVLINADINGAINIMRKYLATKKIKMTEILGKSICNPVIIKIK